ncbi:hypothetical protein NL676_017775 [Syzygium grande]|nr:hypothetical protein NL676_017775 [Syzygium grande]
MSLAKSLLGGPSDNKRPGDGAGGKEKRETTRPLLSLARDDVADHPSVHVAHSGAGEEEARAPPREDQPGEVMISYRVFRLGIELEAYF